MLVQESLLGQGLHSKDMHETTYESDEETLSLCDLPLYSDQSVEWDRNLSLDSHASTSISSQDDYFEFFSHELNPSAAATNFPQENIIFCGKLIPYKQSHPTQKNPSSTPPIESKNKPIKNSLFRWKQSNGSTSTTQLMQQSAKKTYNTNKHKKGHALPVHKMSICTSSSSGKAKWYLLLFGISRFSPEMELRDIKTRRSFRRQRPSSPPPPMFRFENRDEEVGRGRNRGWGLWGLMIRALSCGGNHQPTTVAAAASIDCLPPE